ncbi:hypothetical protein DESC_480296 [Desulfosarcina cetonica]|nr:hypothetical protein DESC_480296 [Desulfosarcina cetonica]
MAVPRMSPGHPDAVGPIAKGRQGKFRTHPARTGDADDAHVGRILHPADTGQIGGSITAPVAQKGHDFRFPFSHGSSPCVRIRPAGRFFPHRAASN